jgi:hypothetical protein
MHLVVKIPRPVVRCGNGDRLLKLEGTCLEVRRHRKNRIVKLAKESKLPQRRLYEGKEGQEDHSTKEKDAAASGC